MEIWSDDCTQTETSDKDGIGTEEISKSISKDTAIEQAIEKPILNYEFGSEK